MRSGVSGRGAGPGGVAGAGGCARRGCGKVGELQGDEGVQGRPTRPTRQQDYKKAAELYEEASQADPEPERHAYFFLGNSYDNLYKPSKKGEAGNDALLTKAVENYQMAAEKLAASDDPTTRSSASCRSSTWSPPTAPTS